jgi:hypothetical protein
LVRYPDLRLISTEELGLAIRQNDPGWIEQDLSPRISAWLERVRTIQNFWRLARVTGLAGMVGLMQMLVGGREARS